MGELTFLIKGCLDFMPELFGTDGVRGIANKDLTPELSLQLGKVTGAFLKNKGDTVLIGRDTRVSGTMLESAFASGLASVGMRAQPVGIIPTPGVAFLVSTHDVAGGVMISASHNPVPDNGIKIFDQQGFKLTEQQEETLESMLEQDDMACPIGLDVGKVLPVDVDMRDQYLEGLIEGNPIDLSNYRIVLDCAYGATYHIGPALFEKLGAQVIPLNDSPRGDRINVACGSTNPKLAAETVLREGADVGLSFDGDGDRVIAIDSEGQMIDGDQIMAIIARHMKEKGRLTHNKIVATVMSNLGLKLAMENLGITLETCQVGDRYVLEKMHQTGTVLGGEQSGHIINLNQNTTGDGLLTGIKLLEVMRDTGESLRGLSSIMKVLPQILVNVKVQDKKAIVKDPKVIEVKENAEKALGTKGRVLLRPSGTEPVVRVMAEGEHKQQLEEVVQRIAKVIQDRGQPS